jgi:hypothetical protein
VSLQEFFSSRNRAANVSTYVGQTGRMFYNEANGVIRISDGITPGGVPIPYTIASNTVVGGIKAGPGANISTDGTLTIDTSGLPLSIGNLEIFDTTISTLVANVDLNLEANGQGQINLVGNVHIHTTEGGIESDPIVDVTNTGQVTVRVPLSSSSAAVQVIGSNTGGTIAPGLTGAMLHVTGQRDIDCRLYYDGNGGYVAHNSRSWNGNITSGIESIKAGDDVMRFNATAATSSGMGNVAFAQMRYTATEDQTPTAQGSNISFWTTAIGTSAANRVQVANISVENGVNARKFTTTGNISAGNINVTGTVSGHYTHALRNAGTIADGGTVTLDFTTDDIVVCEWNNGLTVGYTNFIPGRSVRLIAQKGEGSGTDTLNLDGIYANHTSTGSTTISGAAGQSYILEFYSTNSSLAGLYVKI